MSRELALLIDEAGQHCYRHMPLLPEGADTYREPTWVPYAWRIHEDGVTQLYKQGPGCREWWLQPGKTPTGLRIFVEKG